MAKNKSQSSRRQARSVSPTGRQKKKRASSGSTDRRKNAAPVASARADWMRWPGACQQVFVHLKAWRLVLAELTPSLQSGEIKALVRVVDLRTNKSSDHLVPREFWAQVRIWEADDGGLDDRVVRLVAKTSQAKCDTGLVAIR